VSAALEQPEEVLIVDDRARLTPSDMVERKLSRLLRGASMASSHMQRRGPGTTSAKMKLD